jgi:LytS/YehU family sensor histidine kinase
VGSWLHGFYNGILSTIVLYTAIAAVTYVMESRVRLARQEMDAARLHALLAKTQLDALRRQIEPHFLFNTLNAVAGLVREGRGEAAVSMIVGLSDFLRRMLEDNDRQEVPLGEEMNLAQKYMDIQKVRFAERLDLSVDVPPELLPARVPTLILQLMLENAIKHGIAKRAQGGLIRIAAARRDDRLRLSVYNDGPNLPVNWETAFVGVGISNMRNRLHRLYGNEFELRFENERRGGVEVSVTMPFVASAGNV